MSAAVQKTSCSGLEVEDEPVGGRHVRQVSPARVQDALRLRGRAAGVHDVERVFCVERFGRVLRRLTVDHLVPPDVPVRVPGDVLAGAAHHEYLLDSGAADHGLVDCGLEGARSAAPVATVGRDDVPGVAVEDAAAEGIGREAAEDDGVGRAQPCAGEHGDNSLWNHRQVDRDLVAGSHPELGQGVRGPTHRVEQVTVGDGARVTRFALPVERHAVSEARLDVTVDAVDGDVQPAADEPPGEGQVPLEHLGPRLGPVESPRPAPPKRRADPTRPRRRCRAGRWPPSTDPQEEGRCASRGVGQRGSPRWSRSWVPPRATPTVTLPSRKEGRAIRAAVEVRTLRR